MTDAAAFTVCHAQLTGHGGRLSAAARLFPDAAGPWIDLSTGISPWAYPIGERQEAAWARLPQPELLTQLEAAAAACFGAPDPAEIVAVPGSDMAIRLLPLLLGERRAGFLPPIYSGHRAAWPGALPITAEDTSGCDLLILCNPNNPDGRIIPPEKLRALAPQLIVDEAFADATPGISLAPDRRGAIVLRSFGKFFGLAGIRLGFLIADMPLAARLRALLGDWPVSGPAIAMGLAAYRDTGWQAAQRQRLAQASARLDGLLREANLEITGGTPLFRLVRTPGAAGLFRHLGQAGILLRPFAEDPATLRCGLPGEEQDWQRLEAALATWRRTA